MPCGAALALLAAAAGKGSGLPFGLAQAILWGIAALGAIAWLLALRACARIAAPGPGETEEPDREGGGRRLIATRTSVVEGAPADVADGLTRALSSPSWGSAPLLVKREGAELLAAVPAAPPRLGGVPCFSRCEVRLGPAGGGKTEVTFRTDFTAVRRRCLMVAKILLGLGLLVLVALPVLLYFFALPSENPGARAQVLQAIHVGHLLWPPWLVYALYRRSRRATETFLNAAAANASVLAEALAAGRVRQALGG